MSITTNPQLAPLELNPKTGEPFLRLQGREDIILTPLRWDDGVHFIPFLNDPRVYEWMAGPPVPYTEVHAQFWIEHMKSQSDAILLELERAKGQPEPIFVDFCPVYIMRKVNQDGTDVFLGSVNIIRSGDLGELVKSIAGGTPVYTIEKSEKEENEKTNTSRAAGDPKIVWSFGDYLAPAYHGQGIMTDAVRTVMTKWAIPRMNVRTVRAVTFAGNIGSQRVFEKNGFKHIITLKDHREVRGNLKTLDVFEWAL